VNVIVGKTVTKKSFPSGIPTTSYGRRHFCEIMWTFLR